MNKLQKCDAIIVLANLMDVQGNLNEETKSRVDAGVQAFRNGAAPLLIPCGWAYRDDTPICIADAMKHYIVGEHGIPADQVITEVRSRDTVGDAVFTKRNLAAPRNWSSILVVTSEYHLMRSREIFSFVYGPMFQVQVLGAPSQNTPQLMAAEDKSLAAFRATFDGVAAGDDSSIFERLRDKHPFYNGDVYSKI